MSIIVNAPITILVGTTPHTGTVTNVSKTGLRVDVRWTNCDGRTRVSRFTRAKLIDPMGLGRSLYRDASSFGVFSFIA